MNSNEWMKYSLGEICSFISGTAFPRESQNSLNGTIPFIKVSDLNTNGNERWIDYANNYISESEAKKLRAKIHPPFATTFAKIGIALTFNRRRLLRKKTIVDNNMASAVPNKTILDSIFLYYLLLTIDFNKISSGTALPYVNLSDLERIPVDIPPLSTQRRIAEILSALDDKIELNRQTNATLEAIAQAIFKEWFVDFNFPGATGEMVESELGMIPKGWRVGKLGDFGEIVCGKTPSKTNENFFGGNIPFIKIPDMHNSVFIVETSDTLTHEGALSQKNKFLPPNSIIVSCIATIGLVSLTAEKSQTNQQINAIVPFRDILTHYAYFTAKNLKDQLMELGSGGSATLNVNTSSFSNIKCVIPSDYVLSSFEFLVKPLFEGILANQQEILSIAKCRDELLPKLMNGEIDV
ncbi:MAG: restriction endonuclease subunit S [Caldisericales bacterium]|nr:restriction endonuclease subunit S [Caldisericales bacterium]